MRKRASEVHKLLSDSTFWSALEDLAKHGKELQQHFRREIWAEWFNTRLQSMFVEVLLVCVVCIGVQVMLVS